MATLIQSKQIQGVVTASVIEGNFSVQGQIIATGSDSIFGSINVSAISSSGPIYGVRYEDVQGTPSFVGGTGILITQVGDVITITNTGGGDGVSGSAELISSVTQLNSYTGSNDIIILGLQSQIDSLIAATSSYETKGRGIISGSDQLTSSFDSRYALSGSIGGGGVSDFTELTNIPSGLVSSSDQILGGTGILSGSHTDISSLNQFTSSIQSQVDALITATSSYLTSETDSQTLSIVGDQLTISDGNTITIPTGSNTTLPTGLISSSQQIQDLGFVTSSNEVPFNGNRVVSNTLLGDLYTSGYNAGTSGSLADFINEVFFPSAAPTATFTEQTAKFNTNLATDGTNLNSVSITDTVDDSPYTLTLNGTDASSFTAVPTNSDSSSWEIRANGDLSAGTYSYNVVVGDKNSATTTYSGKSITIAQADNGTLATNGTLYIIESAISGVITLSSTGRPGSTGVVSVSYSPNYGTQVATNFSSSNPLISVNSTNGQLSVGSPISGSGNLAGSTITSTISWEDQYGNTDSANISVNVTTNFAPTRSATTTTNNNTNQATGSAQIIRLVVADTESDSIPNSGLVWGNYNSTYFSASVSSPYLYLHANNTSIPAGVYPYTTSFSDVHGFRTSSFSSSVTINQAVVGTLGGDTTSYIIESAESGDSLRDATGFNAGNPSQLTVSYSPNYGSQVVQSFTSSNPSILVSNNGLLTLGVDLSGSVTQSGDTISTNITFEDQYGNVGSGSVTVNVFANNAPTITFVSSSNYNEDNSASGSNAGTITISDTESNTPFQVSLGGTDGGKFVISGSNSPYKVQPTGSLSVGTYTISITATDDYGKTTTVTNKNIIVDSPTNYGVIYVYTQNLGPAGSWSDAQYKGIYGISVENGDTPPEVTSFTTATSMLSTLVNNDVIGDNTITFASTYTMTLRDTIDGDTTLYSALAANGNISFSGTANILLLYPSGSDMEVPTTIQQTINGTSGGGVPYLNADSGGWGIAGAKLNSITLNTPHLGYSEWFVLGRLGTDGVGSSFQYRIVDADGGSAPS